MKNIYVLLYQFLPVVILLSYLLYPDVFTKVSHHPLGKFLVVLLIAIIAHRNFTHGIILCLIIVLYYHQTTASFQNFFTESFDTTTTSDISPSGQNYVNFMPKEAGKEGSGMFEGHLAKGFTSVGEAYVQKTLPPIKRVNEAIFRKQKCNASQYLTQDGRPIRHLDDLEHVYPNVEFRDGVCDKSCHFTVQKRQMAENELTLPKSSKDNIIWDMVSAFFSSSEEPVVLTNSIVASTVDQ